MVEPNWTAAAGARSYNIYRSANDPYFVPPSGAEYGSNDAPPWADPDPNALGNALNNYTCVVRSANECGESAVSKHNAEFDFVIVPGDT